MKKLNADAATGELKCFPKEEVIAAMIGIPIPAKSIIVANDNILFPPIILVFFPIFGEKPFF
jgi:hypothetical protein